MANFISKQPKQHDMKKQVKFGVTAFLMVGLILISANYIAPHTLTVQKIVQVTHQIPIPYKTDTLIYEDLIYLDINSYQSFPINLNSSQRLSVAWSCETSSKAYLFTKSQFNDYITNLQQIQQFKSPFDQFTYEATSYIPRQYSQSFLQYNVTTSDSYVLLIRNSKQGYSFIDNFNASVTTYNYQTQYTNEPTDTLENDNLYLFLGIASIATAVLLAVFLTIRRNRQC